MSTGSTTSRDLSTRQVHWDREKWLHAMKALSSYIAGAGDAKRLTMLLTNFAFMQEKISHCGINALLDDYRDTVFNHSAVVLSAGVRRALRLVGRALEQGAHVIAEDCSQIGEQLTGRLQGYREKEIVALLRRIVRSNVRPWLCPVNRCLVSPDAQARVVLVHTDEPVSQVEISPDGKYVASAKFGGRTAIWSLERGRLESRLVVDDLGTWVCFGPDSDCLVVGGNLRMSVWDLGCNRLVKTWSCQGHWSDTPGAVTPDGRMVVSMWRNIVGWDLSSGQLAFEIGRPADAYEPGRSLSLMHQTSRLVVGTFGGALEVWNLGSGKQEEGFAGHAREVVHVGLTEDDAMCVSASGDGVVRVWSVRERALLHEVQCSPVGDPVVRFIPGTKHAIVLGRSRSFERRDLLTGHKLYALEGPALYYNCAAVSGDGRTFVAGAMDGRLVVFHIRKRRHGACATIGAVIDNGMVVSPDGSRVILVTKDCTIGTVLAGEHAVAKKTPLGFVCVHMAGCTDAGEKAILLSRDGIWRVWDMSASKELYSFPGGRDRRDRVAIAYGNPSLVVGTSEGVITIWDLRTGEQVASKATGLGTLTVLAVTPDGKRILSAHDISGARRSHRSIRVWGCINDTIVEIGGQDHIAGIKLAAMAPRAGLIVLADTGGVLGLWDVCEGKKKASRKVGKGGVHAVTWSPDGEHMIVGIRGQHSENGEIAVVNASDLEIGTVLQGHSRDISSLACSLDGSLLVSCSQDHSVKLWSLSQDIREIAAFCGDGRFRSCGILRDNVTVVTSDSDGRVCFLRLVADG